MHLVFAKEYLAQALKSTSSHCCASSSACVRVFSRACDYSTSCQPSLETGDSSAGEVHEESRTQKSGFVREIIQEKKGEFVLKKQVCSKAFDFSTSCQPSLEVGDSSAGRFCEESRNQKNGCVREIIEEKKEAFTHKTQLCSKACDYSTSSQPSLELGNSSAGEVCEESRIQKNNRVIEVTEEKKEELVFKTQLVEKVQPHLKPDQEEGLKKSPLKVIVQSCVKRWFKEHLKHAENGDSDAQVIVGQMISHGYGVPKDVRKGEEWFRRALRRQKPSKGPLAGVKSSEKKRSQDEDLYFM